MPMTYAITDPDRAFTHDGVNFEIYEHNMGGLSFVLFGGVDGKLWKIGSASTREEAVKWAKANARDLAKNMRASLAEGK